MNKKAKKLSKRSKQASVLFIEQKELIYRLRIDPETNTKAVTNLLEFKMNLAGNNSLIKIFFSIFTLICCCKILTKHTQNLRDRL